MPLLTLVQNLTSWATRPGCRPANLWTDALTHSCEMQAIMSQIFEVNVSMSTYITSGNFRTTSDFWIGNVPFKILCGRPWKVQNKINIEEQNNGTWLLHRAVTGEAVWEVCAVPAQNTYEDGINSHLFGHHHHHHHHCHHHHPFTMQRLIRSPLWKTTKFTLTPDVSIRLGPE